MRKLLLAAALLAAPAAADNLTVTKTATVVSDSVNTLNYKALPGSQVDYRIIVTNPLGNALKPVKNIVIEDQLPSNVALRVSDLVSAGQGPVEFSDGVLLNLGLLGSGMTCTFTSLSSATDCIDFYDGTSWGYTPVPDADGYDANVRAIRVKPVTTFTTGGSFQIRFRVRIR
jgi:uncharacterized repeat protein (TIGR01451 family)